MADGRLTEQSLKKLLDKWVVDNNADQSAESEGTK